MRNHGACTAEVMLHAHQACYKEKRSLLKQIHPGRTCPSGELTASHHWQLLLGLEDQMVADQWSSIFCSLEDSEVKQ